MASARKTPTPTTPNPSRRSRRRPSAPHERFIGVYVRVSSNAQDHRSQMPDLERWAAAQELPVTFFVEKHTGRTMDRPQWNKLMDAVRKSQCVQLCIWRLDRAGRTASGLTQLFDELTARKVSLVSLKDGFDLATPSGRLLANMLASISQFETELRGERVRAGQQAAMKAGKRWGGSKAGVRKVVTPEKELAVKQLHARSTSIAAISRTVGLSRSTVYSLLRDA